MGDVYPKFRAAAIQAAPVYLDREQTVDKTIALIEEASKGGAQLIALPESFIPGYPYFAWLGTPMWSHELFKEWFKNSVEIPSKTTDALCEAARKANAYLVVGVTERDGNTAYNTLLFVDRNGRIMGKHRKLMPTHVERTVWGMGDGRDLRVFDTDFGKIGGLICWEHTMDLVRHSMYTMGERVHVAAWVGFSNVTGWEELFNMSTELSARYHAHVGECFVINVQNTSDQTAVDKLCQTDYQKEWFSTGGGWTAIIAPGGPIIAGPLTDEEGILYADIDLEGILDMAHWHDAVGHYARPDVVSLLINKEGYMPAKPMAPELAATVTGPSLDRIRQMVQELDGRVSALESPEGQALSALTQELERELSQV